MRVALMLSLLVVLPVVTADTDPVVVQALAVADTPEGLQGVTARVEARALIGQGGVFLDTKPLSETDMQGSARLAARVAAQTLGKDPQAHDFLLSFRSGSTVVGGPSAGAVMALAMTAALWQLDNAPWTMDRGVAATGTINPDGTIGPVGGVPSKAEGAARAGLHTVAYPAGQETTQQNGRTIHMDDHCRTVGIRCVPVASLTDLIEVVAGQRLERENPPLPGTAELPQLEASVQSQVDALEHRLASTSRAQNSAGPVATALHEAQMQLEASQEELESGHYYLAATQAFRGLIQQRYAAALMDLEAQPEASTVQDHIDACDQAVSALDVPDDADDWTALGAIAAAQVRVAAAQQLHAQAQATLDQSLRVEHWQAALLDASFCIERAGTVAWWASLPDTLPAGQPVQDPEASAQESIDRAKEMVSYALSVQGDAGQGPAVLEAALEHARAGRFPAAMLQAIEAESAASVALQTHEVPGSVLEEALRGAATAVAQARTEGTEPVLSVSLIELASERQGSEALRDLWTARGMALLGPTSPPPEPGVVALHPPAPSLHVTLALVVGLAVGAMAVLVVWASVGRR